MSESDLDRTAVKYALLHAHASVLLDKLEQLDLSRQIGATVHWHREIKPAIDNLRRQLYEKQ